MPQMQSGGRWPCTRGWVVPPAIPPPGAMGPEEGPSPGAERGICPEGFPATQLGAEEAKRPGLGRFKSQQHALPDFSQVVRRRSRETRNRNRKGRASPLLTARLWLLFLL